MAGGRVISGPKYVPGGWDPSESEEEYVAPANPYDTSIVDPQEVTTVAPLPLFFPHSHLAQVGYLV